MNDNDPRPVFIIVGQVRRTSSGPSEKVHVLLSAPDDDSAVRGALQALAAEGFVEADLDQIGEIYETPTDEPHLSAFQGALEGEISIVTLEAED
jgi:hypothetical protein